MPMQLLYSESVESNGLGTFLFPGKSQSGIEGKLPSMCGPTSRRSTRHRTAAHGGHFAMNKILSCDNCGIQFFRKKPKPAAHHFCTQNCKIEWMKIHSDFKKYMRKQGFAEHKSNWKGTNITIAGGRDRAQRWYKSAPCEICGSPKSDRHHKDGDTSNNSPSNIQFLCRKHHMEVDGRKKR